MLCSLPDPCTRVTGGGGEDGDQPWCLGSHEVTSVKELWNVCRLNVLVAFGPAEQHRHKAGDDEGADHQEDSVHGSAEIVTRADLSRLGFSRFGRAGSRDLDQAIDFGS